MIVILIIVIIIIIIRFCRFDRDPRNTATPENGGLCTILYEMQQNQFRFISSLGNVAQQHLFNNIAIHPSVSETCTRIGIITAPKRD
jgi:hypothetical protein